MSDNNAVALTEKSVARLVPAWRDRLFARAVEKTLGARIEGRLTLTLPSGRRVVLGNGTSGIEADLALSSFGVFWRALARGSIGFADAYCAGKVRTSDLANLFRLYLASKPQLLTVWGGQFRVRTPDRVLHWLRRNSPARSRQNIQDHYDLGNAFFSSWLDEEMTYSSGIYEGNGRGSLEEAQEEKYRQILAALALSPGHSVLEIGCGWGGLAERIARNGAKVHGLTLSHEQQQFARERFARAGLSEVAAVSLTDYRESTGKFDRVVSIEMIEAVGEENWPTYFDTLRDRLEPGGAAVIQAITIAPDIFERYRRKADFIQRRIFPGGMLPTEATIERHANLAGLTYERISTFGSSYALTLREWRRRFLAAWPELERQGFDLTFKRKWLYYLTYCEIGFEAGTTDVGLYRLTKDN